MADRHFERLVPSDILHYVFMLWSLIIKSQRSARVNIEDFLFLTITRARLKSLEKFHNKALLEWAHAFLKETLKIFTRVELNVRPLLY